MRAVVLMLVLAVSPAPSPGGLLGGVVGDLLDILPSRPAVSQPAVQPASPAPAPTRDPPAEGKSPGPVAPRSPSSERVVSTVPSGSPAPRADAPQPSQPAVRVWVLAAVGLAGLLGGLSACLVARSRRGGGASGTDPEGLGPRAIDALRDINRRLSGGG